MPPCKMYLASTRVFYRGAPTLCSHHHRRANLCLVLTRCGSDDRRESLTQLAERISRKFHSKLEPLLRRYFPPAHQLYMFVRKGTSQLMLDRQEYKKMLGRIRQGKKLEEFSRAELEMYYVMKRDYLKIIPIIFMIFAPFGWIYIVVALLLPKYLLPHQFLSPHKIEVKEREDYMRRARHHHTLLVRLLNGDDGVSDVIKQLRSGNSGVDVNKVSSDLLPTFSDAKRGKHSISSLSLSHQARLCTAHGMLPWISYAAEFKLRGRADMLTNIDGAVRREGVSNLNNPTLSRICLERGLHPDLNDDIKRKWLKLWLQMSRKSAPSLLLHQVLLLPWSSPMWKQK